MSIKPSLHIPDNSRFIDHSTLHYTTGLPTLTWEGGGNERKKKKEKRRKRGGKMNRISKKKQKKTSPLIDH